MPYLTCVDISDYIQKVPEDSRLLAAIVIITWVSAIVSAIIDSIPDTTAMVPPPPPFRYFL